MAEGIDKIQIATGYWDIPGMTLVIDELTSFLEREGTSLELLIGKDPYVYTSLLVKPKYKDASYPYDEKMTTLFFSDYSNGEVNPYIWTGSKNLVRMVNIISRDLIRLYPQNKAKIEKNVNKFTNDLLKIENEANEKLLSVGNAEVISLSENLQYFLNDMNIYAEYVDYDSVTAENIANLVKDKGIKVVISDRWLKKNVIKALKDAGGEFVIINTLDIPMDKDGKMDPEAILKAFKENTDNLIEALKK